MIFIGAHVLVLGNSDSTDIHLIYNVPQTQITHAWSQKLFAMQVKNSKATDNNILGAIAPSLKHVASCRHSCLTVAATCVLLRMSFTHGGLTTCRKLKAVTAVLTVIVTLQ